MWCGGGEWRSEVWGWEAKEKEREGDVVEREAGSKGGQVRGPEDGDD